MTDLVVLYLGLLAVLAGYELIARVPALLHTPLMSATNFIHGIVVVGALAALFTAHGTLAVAVAWGALVAASANVVGGFVTTERMLRMFRASREEPPR